MTVAQIQTPPRLTMIMRYEARARNFFVKRSLSKNAPSAKLKTTPRMAMTREPRALSRKSEGQCWNARVRRGGGERKGAPGPHGEVEGEEAVDVRRRPLRVQRDREPGGQRRGQSQGEGGRGRGGARRTATGPRAGISRPTSRASRSRTRYAFPSRRALSPCAAPGRGLCARGERSGRRSSARTLDERRDRRTH